jgi:hypothetical protein
MKPINPKNFGSGTGKLLCTAILDIGVGVESCYILEQTGSRRYNLASVSTPSRTLVGCFLVEGTPVALGQMHITVTPFGGSALSAKKIFSYQVETFENDGRYSWLLATPAAVTGQATVQHS